MADEIRLVTFEGQNVAPINDALMWETAIGDSGVIYGCETTLKDASTLHIETGYGVVCGRHFQIFESDIPVTLSPGGDLLGRLYVHMDLSDASEPIQLLVETAASLTPVEQDDNVNITNGVWEFNLATFDLNALTISNLVNVFPTVAGGGSNLIAGTETGPNASEAYVAGQYIIWASRLWEVIDAIAVGDQFVIGSNLSATNTTVGSELTKLNGSLTGKQQGLTLLWQNLSPDSIFAAGNISLPDNDGSKYNTLVVIYGISAAHTLGITIASNIYNNYIHMDANETNTSTFVCARNAHISTQDLKTIAVQDCYGHYIGQTGTIYNGWLRPLKIYGTNI